MYELSILNKKDQKLAYSITLKSLQNVADHVIRHPWSPFIFANDQISTSENFYRTSIIVFDVDDIGYDENSISLDEIKKTTEKYSHIIIETQCEHDNHKIYRILMFFDNIITDKTVYDYNYEHYATNLFNRS